MKEVTRKHVSAILSPNRSIPENDFLGLVRSLSKVGLGGEKYVSTRFFELVIPFQRFKDIQLGYSIVESFTQARRIADATFDRS